MDGTSIIMIMFVCLFLGGMFLGIHLTETQAIERGYMVQCVGQSGWHWECD
jgi:hypothetical protein